MVVVPPPSTLTGPWRHGLPLLILNLDVEMATL